MTGPPPYLIVQVLAPLRLPLKISPIDGRLVHAVPKHAFDRFNTVEEAQEAADQALAQHPSELITVYQIISLAGWEEEGRPRRHRRQNKEAPDESR